jgi:hypothetical protein|tara:strand:- start:4073 stop:4414 length:342 start_codon:yes stop_codon:yes gene_type:complete
MIQSIEKKVIGEKLEVKVVCNVRRYSKNPVILLTTDKLIDILNKEYKIAEVIEEPLVKVGNSNIKKVSHTGQWVFRLEKKKQARKTATRKKQPQTPQDEKPSIRNRISKLVKD